MDVCFCVWNIGDVILDISPIRGENILIKIDVIEIIEEDLYATGKKIELRQIVLDLKYFKK